MSGEKHEVIPWYARGMQNHKTMLVAEIGNIHEGSLGNIIRLIEASALAGVDAVKLQQHFADESSIDECFPDRFHYHPQDENRKDYWERLSIPLHWWFEIIDCCDIQGVKLIVSPFSICALDMLEGFTDHIWGYKVASGEMNNRPLLEAMGKTTGKKFILSSGMSDTLEINTAVSYVATGDNRDDVFVLQCTTEYPCPYNEIGMNVVDVFSRNLLFKGGLSDHSGTIYPGIIASYLGAHMVEVHVCWDHCQFGADASSSLNMSELKELVRGMAAANIMRQSPVNKDLYKAPEGTNVYREGKVR